MNTQDFLDYIKEMRNFWEEKYNSNIGNERNVVGRLDSPLEEYISHTEKIKNTYRGILEKGDTIIDYGCGIGRFIEPITEFYKNYIGVDIVNKLPEGYVFLPLESFLDNKTKVDAILTSVVLQHITNDKYVEFLFTKFRNSINIGGCLYLNEQVGDNSILIRRGFSYLKKRDKNFYINSLKGKGFVLVKSDPKTDGHCFFKFKREK